MVGDVDVERLAGGDLGLDALGKRKVAELGFGAPACGNGSSASAAARMRCLSFHGYVLPF